MKCLFLAINGGAKVMAHIDRPKRRLIPALVLVISLLSTSAVFAQGSIFGSVTNSNATVPANGEISFFGYLDDTDEEIRIETSIGAGYDAGNWYDDFQNYLTEAPGNPYDYHFFNTANGQGYVLSKLIPNNSFQQEDITLTPVSWPAAVNGLAGQAISSSAVLVRWNAVPSQTYHIYRRLATSSGSFFRIDDPTGSLSNAGVTDSFFIDTSVDGISDYQYIVIVEDGSGNLSRHSVLLAVSSSSVQSPVVNAITPSSGYTVGGTPITITGNNFDMAGATATIGGASVTSLVVVSPFEITGLTPPGAAGPADVFVTNLASGQASVPLFGGFTYQTNIPPVLDPIGPQTVAEGGNLNLIITSSDADATIPALSTSALPANATFLDNGDGSGTFDFNPDFTQAGGYSVTFYAADGIDTDSETVSITVTGTNQDPVLDPIGPQTVAEGTNLNLVITSSDADGTIPTLSSSVLPTNATFLDNGDGTGTFDFNPDFTQEGSYPVTFYATDGIATDSETVTITVTGTNQDPLLDPIGPQTVAEGANLNLIITASDPDGTIPTFSTSALPANATFLDNGNGSGTLDFNPDFTQAGLYPVTFYATDGIATDSEAVTITVTGTNQDPVLDPIGPQTVAEGANLNLIITASDPDGTIPTFTTSILPANATFLDNGDGSGTLDFNPDFTQEGSYPVTFYTTDGIATDSEAVTITVTGTNQDPVLDPIGPQSVAEGGNLNLIITASDLDGTIPIFSTSTLPTNATFVDNLDGTGIFDFNPDVTQEGSYPVTFYATDGNATDSETVTITVTGTNQDPVLDPIGPQTVAEGANLNLVITASDPDGVIPTLSTSTLPANATFLDNGDGSGILDFNPDFTQAGAYPVTFYATDGIATDSEAVTITVTGTNQDPILDPIGPQTVAENANLNLIITASDPDGNIPTLSSSTLPTNATFLDNGDGTGTLDFNPDFTQEGSYPVTFYATDGVATDSEAVTITVTNINQDPILDPIGPQTVAEGGNLNLIITASDPDGIIPTLSSSTLPANATFLDNGDGSGIFDFNPDITQEGSYPVTFYATDGVATDSEAVTITVTGTNQDPILDPIGPQTVAENANLNLIITASDADATIPTLSSSLLPANATFLDNGDGSGTFDFNPDFTQEGPYSVTFYATDGISTDSEAVAITVTHTNQAPILDPIGPQLVAEGANLNIIATSSDGDGTIPALSTSVLPTNATFVDNLDGTGTFDFNPDFTQSGVYNITFYADDGVDTDSESVAVTVNETGNQFPILDPIGPQVVDENANLNFLITSSDPDGDTLTLTAENLPFNATFIDNLDGTGLFDFNPDFTQSGVYNVTFIASDGLLADTEVVAVTINDINRLPVLDPIGPQTVTEGANLNFTVTASDADGPSMLMMESISTRNW
jgi:voltage-gated potassium channel Kch